MAYSNTTLVKVKYTLSEFTNGMLMHSNTTLVKVKSVKYGCILLCDWLFKYNSC